MGVLVQLAQALHSDHGLVLAQAALAVQAKNLETLEKAGLIGYDNRMIKLTKEGMKLLANINSEISQCMAMHNYFEQAAMPKRRLQTVITKRFI